VRNDEGLRIDNKSETGKEIVRVVSSRYQTSYYQRKKPLSNNNKGD